jgi:hypothetical protein
MVKAQIFSLIYAAGEKPGIGKSKAHAWTSLVTGLDEQ